MPWHARRFRAAALSFFPLALAALSCTASTRQHSAEPPPQVHFDVSTRFVAGSPAPAASSRSLASSPSPSSSASSPEAALAASQIVGLVTRWYQSGWVDPDGWSNPAFPQVLADFTGDARVQAANDIGSITIGTVREDVTAVSPNEATLRLTIYSDSSGVASYAIAAVRFDASATPARGGPLVHIKQSGTYYLRPDGGAWKVFSYVARAEAAQNPQSSSPPSGAPS
jgi:hypothetical protein